MRKYYIINVFIKINAIDENVKTKSLKCLLVMKSKGSEVLAEGEVPFNLKHCKAGYSSLLSRPARKFTILVQSCHIHSVALSKKLLMSLRASCLAIKQPEKSISERLVNIVKDFVRKQPNICLQNKGDTKTDWQYRGSSFDLKNKILQINYW